MRITTKEVRDLVSVLDDIVKKYKENTPSKDRDWRTYEQQAMKRIKTAFTELRPLVKQACKSLTYIKTDTRGNTPTLKLEQKVLTLLLKHIIGKSNRNMAGMFTLFSWLNDIEISYKTVERLYSDDGVILALHNLHVLLLKKKGVSKAHCSGDGTGYTLTVKKNYANMAQKLKDKLKTNNKEKKKKRKKILFLYSFAILDLDSHLYVGYGSSFKSEQDAFNKAIELVNTTGIDIESLRLDRYFSAQKYVKLFEEQFGNVKVYLIPKKEAPINGSWKWKRMLYDFKKDTEAYLKEYFQRNQSESCIAEDKKRVGWKLGQKRPDRLDTANILTLLWHNLHWQ
jgi:transposase